MNTQAKNNKKIKEYKKRYGGGGRVVVGHSYIKQSSTRQVELTSQDENQQYYANNYMKNMPQKGNSQ